jgi:hypothetical protein
LALINEPFYATVQMLGQAVRTPLAKYEVVVSCPDASCPVRTPPPRNPFLTCFKIYIAYLKGLIGSVIVIIPIENSSVLREEYLGINIYMYFS